MSIEIIAPFFITMLISGFMIPLVIKTGKDLRIVAKINHRTIHKKQIVRIGGLAIYLSFLLGAAIFLKTDRQINSILIAGFLVFMMGLYDDIHDLSPRIKVIVELIASLVVIVYGGIYLKGFEMVGLLPADFPPIIPGFITIIWIVGITNAINLIDGLDGLSAGISIIVLFTISMTSLTSGRTDIASLSFVLAGAIAGFLYYNFHPARIFMGDCGALFIGFMIAVISLLGFGYKVSTFFTLGAPIVVLMVPIMDTLIAIIRRKIHHKKFSEADRSHLHHNLMFKMHLGQTKSVLVLYGVTILFSITSYIYLYDATLGQVMFVVLMIFFELFVELSNMISRKYKPLLTILNIFIRSNSLPKIKMLESFRKKEKNRKKLYRIAVIILLLMMIIPLYYVSKHTINKPKNEVVVNNPYILDEDATDLMRNIYSRLETANLEKNRREECQLAAVYFLVDYTYYRDNKVGGMDYVYPDIVEELQSYGNKIYQEYPNYQELQIKDYKIISYSPTNLSIEGIDNAKYYNVLISYEYDSKEIENNSFSANVTMMYKDNRYYVMGIDYV